MDDVGIDAIETSVAVGVAMEAGIIPFGDGPGSLRLLKEIGAGKTYGVTAEEWRAQGWDILLIEHEFNLAAGFTNKDDRLPEFFKEPLPPHNAVWDFTDEEIDSFWNF